MRHDGRGDIAKEARPNLVEWYGAGVAFQQYLQVFIGHS
jgi:hypothetical protein